MATINQTVLNHVKKINPNTSVISSIGTVVSAMQQQIADNHISDCLNAVAANSLAHTILMSTQNIFTEKQIWAIYFKVMKNAQAVAKIEAENEEIQQTIATQQAFKSAKKSVKKVMTANIKKEVASNVASNNDFVAGDKVAHLQFGEGKIISNNDNVIVAIFNGEEKKFAAKFVKLTKI